MTAAAEVTFRYGVTKVDQLGLVLSSRNHSGRRVIAALEVDGEMARTTKRFWKSFFARFKITDNVFRYFEPEEVFQRIAERTRDESIQYCIEQTPRGANRLLGISDPRQTVLDYDQIRNAMLRHGSSSLSYVDGVVTSYHVPRSGDFTFKIGGDSFQNRFAVDCPVDGFRRPAVYLSLMRMICANGAVGMAPAFRGEINLGKRDGLYAIERVLESYDNGDGYAALRQRFESAQSSWASVGEYLTLLRVVQRCDLPQEHRAQHVKAINKMAGEVNAIYGLANLDAMSSKRQRILPTRCRVYDLLNYASEAATHHVNARASRVLQGYIGNLISDEYDMEGTAEEATDFNDFFLPAAGAGPRASVN